MKAVCLAFLALSPLTAFASGATTLACTDQNVDFTIVTKFGLEEGSELTLVTNGVLHAVIDTRIDKVRRPDRGTVAVDVTTIDADGASDDQSGKATLEFAVLPNRDDTQLETSGTVKILLTKAPPPHPSNMRFRPEYDLSSCQGTL